MSDKTVSFKVVYNKFNEHTAGLENIAKIEFRKVIKQNSVGLMYDLIGSTMPFPKGSTSEGGTLAAYENGFDSYKKTINKAFKPIQRIQFGTLAVNKDIQSMIAYGFVFESEILQKAFNHANYNVISAAFERAGFTQDSGYQVIDKATVGHLMEFRSRFPNNIKDANNKYDPYYVRDKESIQKLKVANNQNRIGWMAGGWLKCALGINSEPDEYTKERKPLWMYGKGAGYWNISNEGLSIECTNMYGNWGGWGNSSEIFFVTSIRNYKLNESFKKASKVIEEKFKQLKP